MLDTGVAGWEGKILPGYSVEPPVYVWGLAAPVSVDGDAYAWGFEHGEGEGWRPVVAHERASSALLAYGIAPGRYLQAGTLPPMIDRPWTRARVRHVAEAPSLDTLRIPVRAADHLAAETDSWQGLLGGRAVAGVPAHTRRRVIVDLEDYVCAYPELVTSGGKGSVVRLHFAEGLRKEPDKWKFAKGNRDELEGKFFLGMGDSFRPDGGPMRRFDSLWFASGRYLEIVVETGSEPLRIERLTLSETRYPLEQESRWSCSDPDVEAISPLLVRGMQACAHETFFDCPYFEQMQYVGDLRLEALTQYVMTRDDRLTRKGLYLVDASRHASGLTESRSPVRQPQIIPWFSLVWIGAVHEHALWRDDARLRPLPAARRACRARDLPRPTFPGGRRDDARGLERHGGHARAGGERAHELAARVDAPARGGARGRLRWLELAARCRRLFSEVAAASDRTFWREPSGLYSDGPGGSATSELVQSLALLSGGCPPGRRERVARGLFAGDAASRSDVHTLHYLFEAARRMRRPDVILDRLSLWSQMRRDGLRTPIESAEPTRSDCHAWGSHPLHHFFATLLGVRPATWGFGRVEIAPMLGRLEHASGSLVHPAGGEVVVEVAQKGGALRGRVVLPAGLTGTLRLPSGPRPIAAGETRF